MEEISDEILPEAVTREWAEPDTDTSYIPTPASASSVLRAVTGLNYHTHIDEDGNPAEVRVERGEEAVGFPADQVDAYLAADILTNDPNRDLSPEEEVIPQVVSVANRMAAAKGIV